MSVLAGPHAEEQDMRTVRAQVESIDGSVRPTDYAVQLSRELPCTRTANDAHTIFLSCLADNGVGHGRVTVRII